MLLILSLVRVAVDAVRGGALAPLRRRDEGKRKHGAAPGRGGSGLIWLTCVVLWLKVNWDRYCKSYTQRRLRDADAGLVAG